MVDGVLAKDQSHLLMPKSFIDSACGLQYGVVTASQRYSLRPRKPTCSFLADRVYGDLSHSPKCSHHLRGRFSALAHAREHVILDVQAGRQRTIK